jgi:hypothetical protein
MTSLKKELNKIEKDLNDPLNKSYKSGRSNKATNDPSEPISELELKREQILL